MKKQLFRGLMVGALATFATGISTFAQADGTSSLDLTVKANLTTGTCSASVVENDAETNTIAFGNVYLSEVNAKSKSKTFVLRFSECAGLKAKKRPFNWRRITLTALAWRQKRMVNLITRSFLRMVAHPKSWLMYGRQIRWEALIRTGFIAGANPSKPSTCPLQR